LLPSAHTGHRLGEYEPDHIVPLILGGSNDRSNLQLQPWDEARRKDADEIAVYELFREGALTCQEAQETMREWVSGDRVRAGDHAQTSTTAPH
jgi:hypothetical protein